MSISQNLWYYIGFIKCYQESSTCMPTKFYIAIWNPRILQASKIFIIWYNHEKFHISLLDLPFSLSNIYVTGGQIKIGDFGVARKMLNTFDKAQTLIGTLNNMSPEMVKGSTYDTKSDIWY